jgi:CBS domain containing-hemolysin-like protein
VGEPPAHEALPDGSWGVAGDLPVDEFERLLDRDLPEGDYETLSGLVIAHHGALPQPGEHVLVVLPLDAAQLAGDGEPLRHVADVEVLTVERHVPATVRVSIREAVEPAPLQPEEQP